MRYMFDNNPTNRAKKPEVMTALRNGSLNVIVLDDKHIQRKTVYQSEDESDDDGQWTEADRPRKVPKSAIHAIPKSYVSETPSLLTY
jgi:hypothetical protein